MADATYPYLQAKLEKAISDFLASRSVLLDLQTSGLVTVRSRASQLLRDHDALQTEAMSLIPQVQAIKEGRGNITPEVLVQGTSFVTRATMHVNDVKGLSKEAGKEAKFAPFFDTTTIVALGTLGVLLFFAFQRQSRIGD